MPQAANARADIYTRITAEIVAAIEAGAGDWRMPWHHDGAGAARPINVSSNKAYRGINILALWTASLAAQYSSGLWGTFRQWRALGAQVRKGERATTVVLWKPIDARNDSEGAERETRGRAMFARAFSVFNLAQVSGYTPPPVQTLPESERIAEAEAFIANLRINTEFGGERAYYRPSDDIVRIPCFAAFDAAVAFYGVWLHESGHATGAKHRLDRDLSGGYGSAAYAFEEMIVEQLSGMILADLGLAHHPRPDHAAYISSWLKALEDPRAIFRAASKAQQAADWMHAQQPRASVIAA